MIVLTHIVCDVNNCLYGQIVVGCLVRDKPKIKSVQTLVASVTAFIYHKASKPPAIFKILGNFVANIFHEYLTV